jgi:hypothetical protein
LHRRFWFEHDSIHNNATLSLPAIGSHTALAEYQTDFARCTAFDRTPILPM